MSHRSYSVIFAAASILCCSVAWAQTPPAPPPIELPAMNVPVTTPSPPSVTVPSMPAPTMLPPAEVTVPPASALPIVPESAPQVTEIPEDAMIALPEQTKFSYGDAPYSLLFTPSQVNNMKRALAAAEAVKEMAGVTPSDTPITTEEELPFEPPAITDPTIYPVFQLSSLVYNSPRDWTVWLGNKRITPTKNNDEIKVISVARDKVTFSWKPEFMPVLIQRADRDLFAPVKTWGHKLTTVNGAHIDRTAEQVIFTLKPNQSFSAGHMRTFEGKVAAPNMDPLTAKVEVEPEPEAPPSTAPAGVPEGMQAPSLNPERALMEDRLKQNQVMEGFAGPSGRTPPPVSTTPAPTTPPASTTPLIHTP